MDVFLSADPWFEFTPYEAGYSLIGAFVETSNFGSKFENGRKIKNQPEMDMLYLQALCSSVLADEEEIWKWIKALLLPEMKKKCEKMRQDPNSPTIDECHQVLLNLVNMNLAMLKGVDPSALDKDIRAKLTDLAGGKSQQVFQVEKLNADKKAAKLHMEQYTMDVCNFLSGRFNFWPFDVCLSICRCLVQWIWGRKHNFLHNMTDEAVPAALLESETRDYIDVGLLLNSPYFSVLREERDIDLIISLDFSDGEDPFMVTRRAQRSQHALQAQIGRLQQDKRRLQDEMALLLTQREELEKKCLDFRKEQADILPRLEETKWETVRETAETCRKLKIPFPEANITSELSEKPKDFYVFKGQNTPTVIHIPLFNVVNCGDKIEEWTNKYATFQGPYSAEMITELMEVAGKNITNNRVKLLDQIRAITKAKLIQAVNS